MTDRSERSAVCFEVQHSLLGHDLEVLQGVARGIRLRVLGARPGPVADGNGQGRELDQTLALACDGLLLDVHERHLELLLGRDLLQELDKVEVLHVQRHGLKQSLKTCGRKSRTRSVIYL